MTELEATRLKLKCLEMVEGTYLPWKSCVRFKDTKHGIHGSIDSYELSSLELAIGIVEGKPVGEGDELYHPSYGKVILRTNDRTTKFFKIQGIPGVEVLASTFSWNPPKPKTVMVELRVKDLEYLCAWRSMTSEQFQRLADEAKKALENLK